MGKHTLLVATACWTLLTSLTGASAENVDAEHHSASPYSPQYLENNNRFIRAVLGKNQRQYPSLVDTINNECDPPPGRSLPEHCITDSSFGDIPAQQSLPWEGEPLKLETNQKKPRPVHPVSQDTSYLRKDIPPQVSPFVKRDATNRLNELRPLHTTTGASRFYRSLVNCNPGLGRVQEKLCVETTNLYRSAQSPTFWKRERPHNPRTPQYFHEENFLLPQRLARAVPSSPPAPTATSVAPAVDDDVYVPFSGERLDAFDWRLVRELDHFARSNAVVSPMGVKLVLGMLHEAASRASAAELRTALGLPSGRVTARDVFRRILQTLQEKQDGFVMRVGNKVFLDQSFEPRKNTANIYKTFYSAEIQRVDFKTPAVVKPIINEWVSNLTNGLIKNLITNDLQIANLITMVLNVIYFKGDWLYSFSKQSTTKGSFDVGPGESVEVDYMKLTKDLYYTESEALDAKLLRLPYKGKKYSMFLILPNKKENFKQMIQLITPGLIREQLHSLEKMEVKVKLPKFVFQYTVHLKELLMKLGISRIFTQSDEINLTKNKTNIMISKVIQKVGLEVNEEGTEAASATEVDLVNHFGGNKMFLATHPFLFFVEEEKTGTVVFVGKVMDPSNNKPVKPLKPSGRISPAGRATTLEKDFSQDIFVEKTIVKPALPSVPFQTESLE